MSFAVEIAAAPLSVLHRIHAAMYAFGAVACVLALVYVQSADFRWFAAVCLLVLALACVVSIVSLHRRRAPLVRGSLVVDACGNAAWRPLAGNATHAGSVDVVRWYVLGSYAWIAVRFPDDRRARDLLLRHGGDEPAWRRLRAWLVWYGRA